MQAAAAGSSGGSAKSGPGYDCPRKHGLTRFTAHHEGFGCDVCETSQSKGATLYGCRQCDYDVCASCRPADADGGPSASMGTVTVAVGKCADLQCKACEKYQEFISPKGWQTANGVFLALPKKIIENTKKFAPEGRKDVLNAVAAQKAAKKTFMLNASGRELKWGDSNVGSVFCEGDAIVHS